MADRLSWWLGFALLFACQSAFGQAVWNGRSYSGRQCNNPNCGMCASIQRQLESQRTVAYQAPQPVVQAAPQSQAYRTVTTMEPRTRQVKRCNGKQCWFETVTEMVAVTRQVPVPAAAPKVAPPVVKQSTTPAKIDTLTNTELVPTPQAVVEAMLEELAPSNKAKLFDLGCGDGRIVITAAKLFGCTAVGIELNPETIDLARSRAIAEYVNPLVVLFEGDVRDYDLQPAQFVTMYLYPELMAEVIPELTAGTRIASYQHEIPGVPNIKHAVEVDGQPHVFYTGTKP